MCAAKGPVIDVEVEINVSYLGGRYACEFDTGSERRWKGPEWLTQFILIVMHTLWSDRARGGLCVGVAAGARNTA